MISPALRCAGFVMLFAIAGASVSAADKATGTFTVDGKTARFTQVYASLDRDPVRADRKYLILLVSDVAVAAGDRAPDRLLALAKAGTIHAVRIRWTYGMDTLAVVPYHRDIAESGRAFQGLATLNLTKFDDVSVDAEFKAKMLGQTWFFNAIVKAAVAQGAVATLEPDAPAVAEAPGGSGAGAGNATAIKRQLGG